jgi:Tfp pilus assembly protein PilO
MANNKPKQEMKTSNYIGLLIAISVLVILVGGLAIKTFGADFLHNQRVISKKNTAQKTLAADVLSVKAISNQYQTLGSQAQIVNDSLPNGSDIPGLANAIEAMGSATGTNFTDISDNATSGAVATAPTTTSSSSTTSSAATPININIATSASYANLDKFLSVLESSSRPIQVSGVALTGTNAKLTVTIDAITYYQTPVSFNVTTEAVK